MATKIFRGRMHHEIRAEIERSLHNRRPCIVAGAKRARAVGRFGDGGDVGDFQERIGWRFDPDQFCFRSERLLDLIDPCHVDEAHGETPRHVNLAQQLRHPVINIRRRDDLIAGRERLQDCARCRQAGAEGRRALTAFQSRQPLLKTITRGIRAARVNVSVRITAFRIALERRGQMDRHRDRASCRIDRVPGVHRQRFNPNLAFRFHIRSF